MFGPLISLPKEGDSSLMPQIQPLKQHLRKALKDSRGCKVIFKFSKATRLTRRRVQPHTGRYKW